MQYWEVKKNKKSNTDNSPVFRLYPKIEKKTYSLIKEPWNIVFRMFS